MTITRAKRNRMKHNAKRRRKREKKRFTAACPYCGAPAQLKDSAVIYHRRSYGPAWICSNYPQCDAYVGCHPGTKRPLGRLSNGELREAKKRAHAVFDVLWKQLGWNRGRAYKWLAEQMEMEQQLCHIGHFDVEQCNRVVDVCERNRRASCTAR